MLSLRTLLRNAFLGGGNPCVVGTRAEVQQRNTEPPTCDLCDGTGVIYVDHARPDLACGCVPGPAAMETQR